MENLCSEINSFESVDIFDESDDDLSKNATFIEYQEAFFFDLVMSEVKDGRFRITGTGKNNCGFFSVVGSAMKTKTKTKDNKHDLFAIKIHKTNKNYDETESGTCSEMQASSPVVNTETENPCNFGQLRDDETTESPSVASTPEPMEQNENLTETAPADNPLFDENFDHCNKCKKGGELVCCSKCPRAFHSRCLGVLDYSADDWSCVECKNDDKICKARDSVKGTRYMKGIRKKYQALGPRDGQEKYFVILSKIVEMIEKLIAFDFGYEFDRPVDMRKFPLYKKLIKKRTDLGTILKALRSSNREYVPSTKRTLFDIAYKALKDVQTVWENCCSFNKPNSPLHKAAKVQEMKCNKIILCSIKASFSESEIERLSKFQKCCKVDEGRVSKKQKFSDCKSQYMQMEQSRGSSSGGADSSFHSI